jgi:hypothetical protein
MKRMSYAISGLLIAGLVFAMSACAPQVRTVVVTTEAGTPVVVTRYAYTRTGRVVGEVEHDQDWLPHAHHRPWCPDGH